MDSFAIASGGATYYRNRIKDLMKNQNMSEKAAEAQAYEEWTALSREAQQSSDALEVSSQQAGSLGRVVLAFANTPMQYNRLIWKAVQDIKNGRGDLKNNLSRIAYYGALQNMMFNALQQAMFAAFMGDEDDEEAIDEKTFNTLNGMLDSLMRGMGVSGTILAAIKSVGLDIYDSSQKKRPEYYKAVFEALNIAPPLDVKVSKFVRGANTYEFNRNNPALKEPFNIDNPGYTAGALIVASTTNIPVDRLVQKMMNIKAAFETDQENWKRIFLLLGWSEWQLATTSQKEEIKAEKKDATHYNKAKDNPKLYNKAEQEDILRQHGYSEDEIKNMKKEEDRVKAIEKAENKSGEQHTSRIPTIKAEQHETEEEADEEVKAISNAAAKSVVQPVAVPDTTKVDSTSTPTVVNFTSAPNTSYPNNRIPIDKRTDQEGVLYELSKQEQIDSLLKLNITKKEIREMKEGDRVQTIIDANK